MMNLNLNTALLVALPLLLLEGFFTGSEIALLSSDKLRLKTLARKGSRGAEKAFQLSKNPEKIFATTLLVTSLSIAGISAIVTLFCMIEFNIASDFFAILFTSPIIIVFGELIPKIFYRKYADQLAPWVAYPIHWTYFFFYPITRFLSSYSAGLSRAISPLGDLLIGKKRTTRDELRSLLSVEKKETEITPSEKKMIKRILDFKDTEAKHALIPLVNVEAIEVSSTAREALLRFKKHRHSRMPVYEHRIDNIIGVLEYSDLLTAHALEQTIRNYITHAYYVAETQALHDLLLEMHKEDNEMVIVVDEYGGAIGIIALEDIVEEIVGEITDEYDTQTLLFKELSPKSWFILAKMEIQKINEKMHLNIPEGNYETLGGFLLQQFGRIPEVGDELFFETPLGLLKFTIKKASERQIETVQIERSTD
ncbi:MAG: HlyC/CorC family transporter [Deltaproteobacteria bacterium]|nr:HlyC/CorC family transporter [Deltaproteobacteria bacterium]